jgi:hypothetical protein
MGLLGVDPSDLRQRAAHLNHCAAELASIEAALGLVIDGSSWVGPDAEAAREQLNGQALPSLRQLQEFVQDTALKMTRIAMEQENISSV